jgi:hypothetical protein
MLSESGIQCGRFLPYLRNQSVLRIISSHDLEPFSWGWKRNDDRL